MDLKLRDKVAVITGGSKGIGYATAECFLQEGAKVAICARHEEELAEAAKALSAKGEVFYQVLDATNQQQVEDFAAAVYEKFGRMDCWINNVGAAKTRAGEDFTAEEVEWHNAICFNSAVYGTQAAARYIKKGGEGGAIVNLSSLAYRSGTAGRSTLYGPLKAAVTQLGTYFAAELAAWNIRVNTVVPYFTVTPAVQETIPAAELDAARERSPLHRIASPEEVAAPIVFLCSSAASYITGTHLEATGGAMTVFNPGFSYDKKAGQ